MKVPVREEEGGLLVCIPSAMAEQAKLARSGEVELRVRGHAVEIIQSGGDVTRDQQIERTPGDAPSYTVEELMEGFTDDQRHPEWDTGPSVGAEAW